MKVLLRTDIDSPSGYSAHARALVLSLMMLKEVDLKLEHHKHDSATIQLTQSEAELYRSLTSKEWTKPDILIHFETPEFYEPLTDCYNIGFTVWETTRIPANNLDGQPRLNWVYQMNRMSEIWAASSDSMKAYKNSGVVVPITLVTGPIDTEFYRPGLPELNIAGLTYKLDGTPIPKKDRPFVIGFMGQWTPRKNIEDWILWITTQFKQNEVVGLMKTYGSHIEGDGGKFVYDRIVTIKRYVRLEEAGADIIVMTEKLTDQQIAKWFQSIDMYVSFSRGEGFALPVVQAMASEVVVAHTGWGGPSDYMEDSKSGLLLPYTMQPVAGMPHNPWYRGNQWWAQVDIFKATEIIKKHMDGSGPVNGKAAREAVVKNCSIPAIAARIAERFAQLYNDGYIKV